ncbi:MAG: 2-hydroxyacyl-CoA dehydratase [Deltaproteobacteria bacterium]|nr:2-hydroxyacyl-CoA dehydratase [Deltaproteobacteria bacterium]
MAQTEKPKAIAKLKSMYPLRATVDESYKKSVEAVAEGKPAVWAMANWWQGSPVLKAMDIEVVYPENYGAVCASMGVAPTYLERADSAGFPTHLCGYARTNYGYTHRMMRELNGQIPPEAPLGGMPKPILLLSSNMVCDARYKWFQGLGRYLDAPVYNLEMPIPGVSEFFHEGMYENSVRLASENIRRLIAFVEQLVGRRLDMDRLAEVVDDMIEMHRVWHEVNELRRARPCPMHSRHFWACMPPALYLLGDIKQGIANYRNLYVEVQSLVEEGKGSVLEEKYRVGFAELPPWHSLGFFDTLAERGWNFVMESWAYHPPVPIDLSETKDPVEKIAKHAIQFNTGYYKYALDNDSELGYMGYPYIHLAQEYQFDGMFLHPLVTCRSASTHLGYVRETLAKKLKVPSLWIEGDIVDFSLFDADDALRKAEAFEEIMDHYRDQRRREGFGW